MTLTKVSETSTLVVYTEDGTSLYNTSTNRIKFHARHNSSNYKAGVTIYSVRYISMIGTGFGTKATKQINTTAVGTAYTFKDVWNAQGGTVASFSNGYGVYNPNVFSSMAASTGGGGGGGPFPHFRRSSNRLVGNLGNT